MSEECVCFRTCGSLRHVAPLFSKTDYIFHKPLPHIPTSIKHFALQEANNRNHSTLCSMREAGSYGAGQSSPQVACWLMEEGDSW